MRLYLAVGWSSNDQNEQFDMMLEHARARRAGAIPEVDNVVSQLRALCSMNAYVGWRGLMAKR